MSHDLETVMHGLTAVALSNGSCRRASRELEKVGVKVAPRTLTTWKRNHAEDYERIRREILPKIGAEVADEHMQIARESNDLEREATKRLRGQLDELPARELANVQRNAAVSAGIHTDKARDLQGDFSTPPTIDRSHEEIVRELEAEGVRLDVITVEVIEETPVIEAT